MLTASYGHEIAILNEILGKADYIAYDTIFLRGVGVSIEGTKLLEVSGEEGITAVYQAGKCYVIRRITTGNGYHEGVLVFNPTHSPVELDVAFSYSTPFEGQGAAAEDRGEERKDTRAFCRFRTQTACRRGAPPVRSRC